MSISANTWLLPVVIEARWTPPPCSITREKLIYKNRRIVRLKIKMNRSSEVLSLIHKISFLKTFSRSYTNIKNTVNKQAKLSKHFVLENVWKNFAYLKKRSEKKKPTTDTDRRWNRSRMLIIWRSKSSKTNGTTLYCHRTRMKLLWSRWNSRKSSSMSLIILESLSKTEVLQGLVYTIQLRSLRCRRKLTT